TVAMPARRSNCSSSHHLTKLALSYAWYPITLVDKLTSRHDRRRKRQPSSKKSWIIAGHARLHRPAPCPISNWGERALCPAAALRPARLTQDFFAIGQDADPAIPILKEAKEEYGKLQ